jgi:hypothetical protein
MRPHVAIAAGILALVVTGCGGGGSQQSSGGQQQQPQPSASNKPANPNQPETNPAGDIPDNQAYVPYRLPGGGVTVKVPEGWSRTATGGAVVFSDKLNSVRIESRPAQGAPSVSKAKRSDVPLLSRSVKGFSLKDVTTVKRHAGTAVRISYLAKAPPNPVTGKAVTDAVERYVFFHNGRDAVLTLSGPKTADNVDPWRIVSNSLQWTR